MGRPAGNLLPVSDPAAEFEELFREVYLTFHRRDPPRSSMAGASRAAPQHPVLAGPLTVREMATTSDGPSRWSATSSTHLERDGPLQREADPADRRRTLVWLTDGGRAALDRDNRVLDLPLIATALEAHPTLDRRRPAGRAAQPARRRPELPQSEGRTP